jgi:hypothetical protein
MSTQVVDPPVSTAPAPRRSRRPVVLTLAAVVLLLAGVAIGWLLRGDDTTPAPVYVGEGVVVGGAELTERQAEMVDLTKQYVTAWMDGDGEAVASFMVEEGYVEMPELQKVLRVDDGSLQEWVTDFGGTMAIPNELNQPIEVLDDHVVLTGYSETLDADWMITIVFTESGEVKIVSDSHIAF